MGQEQEQKTLLDKTSEKLPMNCSNEAFKKAKRALVGSMLALISGNLYVVINIVMQVLKLDFLDAAFVRSVILIHVVTILCYCNGLSLFPSGMDRKTKGFMMLQGLLGGVATTLRFACVQLMPVGDATALIYSAPIFTMLFAWLLLKQRFGLFIVFKVTFALLLMIGAILVTQPAFIFQQFSTHPKTESETFGRLYQLGALLGILTAVCRGLVNVSITICTEVHSLVCLWWSGFGLLLCALFTVAFYSEARIMHLQFDDVSFQDWMGHIGIALTGLLAYFCGIKAFQMIDPTVVSSIRSVDIILAYVAQVVIMHQVPNYLASIGACLIVLSGISIALQDFLSKNDQN